MRNEKGSTLIQVLLVILIFSVLGVSLLGNVVGENKRVNKTSSNVHEKNLARDGLTYFEKDFENDSPLTLKEIDTFFSKYDGGKLIDSTEEDGIIIKPEKPASTIIIDEKGMKQNILQVESKGQDISKDNGDSNKKPLIGHYQLDFDVDFNKRIFPIALVDQSGVMVNFATNDSLLNTNALFLLQAGVIKTPGPDENFYSVPTDSRFLDVDVSLLSELIGVEIDLQGIIKDLLDLLGKVIGGLFGNNDAESKKEQVKSALEDNRFQTMEKNAVIATRKSGEVLKAKILKIGDALKQGLLNVKVLTYPDEYLNDGKGLVDASVIEFPPQERITNVVIDGYYSDLKVKLLDRLGIDLISGYQDINFKKLVVFGNVLIQQDKALMEHEKKEINLSKDTASERTFTFAEGLYVDNSLIIGGTQNTNEYSHLHLSGDMAVMEDLLIQDADIKFIEKDSNVGSNIYVRSNATIQNSCVNSKGADSKLRLFVEGKLTIENNTNELECRTINGLFFAEEGIEIETNDKDLTIYGEVIGEVTVKGSGTVTIISTGNHGDEKFKDIKLIPKGRTYE